ncbi:MAG TPA: M28 family peptidase [Gemmatimonadaceae bacterium]|nr:M28 family peptidase [Gemmatimonadaceae bacterium]
MAWLGGCSQAPGAAAAPRPASLEPDASELRADLFAFAADSFRGRETGTPDADRAAAWIARRLASLGVEPAGDSGYFHRVPMRRSTLTADSIVVTTPAGARRWSLGKDFLLLTALGPGAPLPKLSADAEVVFAGYGLVDAALGRDDYKGLDVKGKVVVIAGAVPAGVDSARRKALQNPDALFARLGSAIGRGPAAIVLLLPDSVFHLAAGQFSGSPVELARGAAPEGAPRPLPMVAIARLAEGSPLLPAGWPGADLAAPLAGTRLVASVRQSSQRFNGYNVVGIVRGSDPSLRNSYVAYGAHYDHIGIQPAVNGDSIANGADDDGSGSVLQLSVARAFAQGPRPRRSVLFVWHVGEEKGLFGSDVFTANPTVPLDSIVAQLNADMVGRNADDSLYIVGPGAAPNGQSAVLGAVLDSVNAAQPRPFVFNREWDTTTHPERIYYRSDHFNYARKGIPIVFFTTGLHPQYHQVTDEAGLINYDKMARIGSLMYRSGMTLGNRATRPKPTATQ